MKELSLLSPFAHKNPHNSIYTRYLHEKRKDTESDTIF